MLTHTCYYVLGSLITFLLPILSFLWGFQSDRPDTRPVRLSDWFETSCYEPLLAVAEKITKNAKLTPQLPYESVCWSYFYLPDTFTAVCYLSLCCKIVENCLSLLIVPWFPLYWIITTMCFTPLLSPPKFTGYNLTVRSRSCAFDTFATLSSFLRKNFIHRMLYNDINWFILFTVCNC